MERIKSTNWQTIVIILLVISNIYLIGKVNEAINTADEAYYKADSVSDLVNDDIKSEIRDLEIEFESMDYKVSDLESRISSVEFDLLWQ